jgi:hypothetical protein
MTGGAVNIGAVSLRAVSLRHNPLVRAVGIPVYRAALRLRPGTGVRVLATSMPKSGTHLLTALLDAVPGMRFSGYHLTEADVRGHGGEVAGLDRALRRVRRGQYVSGHLPARPEIVRCVEERDYRTVFIVRDPRDVAVSDMHYILGFRQHPLHDRLHRMPTEEERLMAMITGLEGVRNGQPLLEPMGERVAGYLGWTASERAITVRFEDLVGAAGGGDSSRQGNTISAVLTHLDRSAEPPEVARIGQAIWSPNSSTFRRGAIGDWHSYFGPAHVERVKELAGAELVSLGYEPDLDW